MATSSRLLVNNGLYPQEASVPTLCRIFTLSTAWFIHNSIISKEVCRVFVLRCQSTSHLTHLVSFHRVTCHIKFIQSCKLHNHMFTQSYIHIFIHSYIQSYIHTLILSHIHTQHMHNINSYMVASITWSLVWLYLFVSVPNYFKLPVLNNGPLEPTFYLDSSCQP
jgi:hypothetical protein